MRFFLSAAKLLRGIKLFSFEYFEATLKLVATFIALFGVWQYFEDQRDERSTLAKSESLNIIRQFSDENIYRAREELFLFWDGQPEFAAYVGAANEMSENEYEEFVQRIFPVYKRYRDAQKAFLRLDDYFDSAYYCRRADLCDREMLDNYLCDKVEAFDRIYGPFYRVLNQRISTTKFGESMTLYAKECTLSRTP